MMLSCLLVWTSYIKDIKMDTNQNEGDLEKTAKLKELVSRVPKGT
jgi:hypothetical protein